MSSNLIKLALEVNNGNMTRYSWFLDVITYDIYALKYEISDPKDKNFDKRQKLNLSDWKKQQRNISKIQLKMANL